MARRKTPTRANAIEASSSAVPDGLVSEEPMAYPIAEASVTALQVYRNPDRRPRASGPWDGEADKIAWIDQATGLGCIILRQEDGTLSGYVGVGPEHPLFAFTEDALPVDIANAIHGGVTYARACEVNRFEQRKHGKPRAERYTVCHVTRVRYVQDYVTVQATQDEFHEDLWWFGFDTNHHGDLVPKPRPGRLDHKGSMYRDQDFVYAHVVELARQLKAADPMASGDGTIPPRLPSPAGDGDGA